MKSICYLRCPEGRIWAYFTCFCIYIVLHRFYSHSEPAHLSVRTTHTSESMFEGNFSPFYCKIQIKFFIQANKIIVSFLCVVFNSKFWNLEDFCLWMCLYLCVYRCTRHSRQDWKYEFSGKGTTLENEFYLREFLLFACVTSFWNTCYIW